MPVHAVTIVFCRNFLNKFQVWSERRLKLSLRPHSFGYQILTIFFKIRNTLWLSIARQRVMHAERDIVMANPSVCPVRLSHSDIVSKRMYISTNSFHHLTGHDTSFFRALTPLKIPRRTPSVRALPTRTWVGIICDFRQKSPFIRLTVYEICPYLLRITKRKS